MATNVAEACAPAKAVPVTTALRLTALVTGSIAVTCSTPIEKVSVSPAVNPERLMVSSDESFWT